MAKIANRLYDSTCLPRRFVYFNHLDKPFILEMLQVRSIIAQSLLADVIDNGVKRRK